MDITRHMRKQSVPGHLFLWPGCEAKKLQKVQNDGVIQILSRLWCNHAGLQARWNATYRFVVITVILTQTQNQIRTLPLLRIDDLLDQYTSQHCIWLLGLAGCTQ